MNFKDQTKALNQTPIRIVGRLLGLALPHSGTINCPFSDHDDRTPSFEVKKSGNRWRCYGCNRTGGAIDFVKIFRGIEFREAKRWLADTTGMTLSSTRIPTGTRDQSTSKQIPTHHVRIDLTESLPDYEVYEKLLQLSPIESSGISYLLGRGLSESTISQYQIGQISNNTKLLKSLRQNFGYERIKLAGLLTKKSTAQDARFLFPSGSILFPFQENDHTVYLQVRLFLNSVIGGKWRNLNHRRHRVYNVDVLSYRQNSRLAICEGVMDTLSAIELGYCAIGLLGVSARLDKNHIDFLRGRGVDILFDWDPPGETRAKQLQQQLRRFGIASTRKRCPSDGVKDVNDYLRTKTALP